MRILARQGEGPAAVYQRAHLEAIEHEQKIDRICAEAVGVEASASKGLKRDGARTAAGDPRRLRGIPVQAKGVGGGLTDAELGFKDVDGSWCSAQVMLAS